MKYYFTNLLFFVALLTTSAQVSTSWSTPQDAANWLNENIAEVRQNKETYNQSVKLNSSKDDYTTLTIKETDAKGSSSITTYEFYLGHLNANKTQFSVKGTVINISAETTNKEKVIRFSKNGAFQVYKNELIIKCDDPQLAKDVVDAINFAISSSSYKALSFNNPSEAISWLEKEVKDIELSESKILQSFEYLENQRKKMVLEKTASDAKSNEKWEYIFYANDFSDLLGSIDVSGEKFNIKFTTIDNQKMVKIFKNGDQQKFNKYFQLSAVDPKMAFDILEAFKAVFAKSSSSANNTKSTKSIDTKPVVKEVEKSDKTSTKETEGMRYNENNNKYEYTEVFEYPSSNKVEIRNALLALIPQPENISFKDENKIVMNYSTAISTYKYISANEKFEFKDGKMKWTFSNVMYVFKKTALSEAKALEDMTDKNRDKALKNINEYIKKSRNYINRGMIIDKEGGSSDW